MITVDVRVVADEFIVMFVSDVLQKVKQSGDVLVGLGEFVMISMDLFSDK